MKNVFFALAVVCTAFGATAMTTVAPGDIYVQTSPGVYQKLTTAYNPALCTPAADPCAFQVPAGDNTAYPATISLQVAEDAELTPRNEGIYVR